MAPSASRKSPFLSKPAASPKGCANSSPQQGTTRSCGKRGVDNRGRSPRNPINPKSCAHSGSKRLNSGSVARATADAVRAMGGRVRCFKADVTEMPWYYRCRLNYARIGVAASYEALLTEYKDTLGRSDYPGQLLKTRFEPRVYTPPARCFRPGVCPV